MDPDATLKLFLDKCKEFRESEGKPGTENGDYEVRQEAIEALDSLLAWLKRGGFMPRLTPA